VELKNVQGQLERAQAGQQRADIDYQRVLNIQKQDAGAVSKAMIDKKRQIAESAGAEIRSLQAAVASAEDRLAYTYLRAPFNGIITATYVENFEDVKAKQPIVRLIDHSQIEMIVNIPESLISTADYLQSAGKVMRVRFDTFAERELTAWIKEIGKEASKTTRTYPITLIMDQPEDVKILPGMAGKATIAADVQTDKALPGIVMPETAVFSTGDSDKTYVWVIDTPSNKTARREVRTGDLLDTGILITEGLKSGEWVATAGVHYLKEGQHVRILSGKTGEVAK
jgi:RND family efflux transporter MFP subunit